MAKSGWILLLLTGILSALSEINLIVSLTSDYWVNAEAKFDNTSISLRNSEVSYGLFGGKLQRYFLGSLSNYDLAITCIYSDNKCFYSCQQTDEARVDEYRRLMNDERLASCPVSSSKMQQFNEQVKVEAKQGKSSAYESEFLSAGLWLSTLVFLSMTLAFAAISSGFAVFNIVCSPPQLIFSVFGLYIWNGIAAGLCCFTLIFWGSLYLIFISNNIGIGDTLTNTAHYSSNDLAGLGYSYWILFVSIVLHLVNIGLVYYRSILLQREPRAPAITISKNDSTILVY